MRITSSKKKVSVKIGGIEYRLPFRKTTEYNPLRKYKEKVVMVTSHPADKTGKKRVLVWREGELSKGNPSLYALEAELRKDGTIEEIPSREGPYPVEICLNNKGNVMDVYHFGIEIPLRGRGLGTALREILIERAKKEGKREIAFPNSTGHKYEYYSKRGFEKTGRRHQASMKELEDKKSKDQTNWYKNLEESGFKIYWAKSKKYE